MINRGILIATGNVRDELQGQLFRHSPADVDTSPRRRKNPFNVEHLSFARSIIMTYNAISVTLNQEPAKFL
jgi:hypothetical protein